ncbi:MAG TPA: GC-type dockerin domain-anchored protein, partial [Phycisphaerales bacterium]|nr:GC-type dockerin domain-anchored protein [Phycisphaerales bacterium]
LAVAALMAVPAAALAESTCHTFTLPGTFDALYNGNVLSGATVNAAGVADCSGPVRALEISCSLQSLHGNTWASEATCDITLPGGQVVSTRLCRLAATFGQIPTSRVRVALPAGTTNADLTGIWGFRFHDTFNDSGGQAECRIGSFQVKVVTETVPAAQKTLVVTDGVSIEKTNPQVDNGAYARTMIKLDAPPIEAGSGEYMRVDVTPVVGSPGPNRGFDQPYAGPWTVAIYNQNGEVLASSGGSLTFNFGASGPDRKDGAAGTMAAGPSTSGPLYVSITPWAVNMEFDYDNPGSPLYPQYLDRSYPPFGVRGQEPALGYYDYTVRVQRGQKATDPAWPDLSTVYTNRPLSTNVTLASPEELRLVRFRLPGPVIGAAGDWLDIDASLGNFLSVLPAGTRNDTEIALFDAAGTLIASDDDDGAGYGSALSFGAASPARPPAPVGPLGLPFDGRDGANLAAGEYYLAVTAYNATFSNGFDVDHTIVPSSVSGNVHVTISGQLTPVFQCGAADIGSQGGVEGYDGVLDNNDFVVFIDRFFANDPRADVGSTGGVHGDDGAWDNNDFVVFIDDFFSGCV